MENPLRQIFRGMEGGLLPPPVKEGFRGKYVPPVMRPCLVAYYDMIIYIYDLRVYIVEGTALSQKSNGLLNLILA